MMMFFLYIAYFANGHSCSINFKSHFDKAFLCWIYHYEHKDKGDFSTPFLKGIYTLDPKITICCT